MHFLMKWKLRNNVNVKFSVNGSSQGTEIPHVNWKREPPVNPQGVLALEVQQCIRILRWNRRTYLSVCCLGSLEQITTNCVVAWNNRNLLWQFQKSEVQSEVLAVLGSPWYLSWTTRPRLCPICDGCWRSLICSRICHFYLCNLITYTLTQSLFLSVLTLLRHSSYGLQIIRIDLS